MILSLVMSEPIKIEVRTVYGNETIYVVSDHKEAIRQLTRKLTINYGDIDALKKLGFTFQQVTSHQIGL